MEKNKQFEPKEIESNNEKLLGKTLDCELNKSSKKNVKQINQTITINRTVAKIIFVFSLVIIVQLLILVGVVVWFTSNNIVNHTSREQNDQLKEVTVSKVIEENKVEDANVQQTSELAKQQQKEEKVFNELVGIQNEDFVSIVGDYTDNWRLYPSDAGILNELKYEGSNMGLTPFRLFKDGKIAIVKTGLYLINVNMLFCNDTPTSVYYVKVDKRVHFSCYGKPFETCSVSGVVRLRQKQVITIEALRHTCFNRKDRNAYFDMTRLL